MLLAGGILATFLATTVHQFLLVRLHQSIHPEAAPAEQIDRPSDWSVTAYRVGARLAIPLLLGISGFSTWWYARAMEVNFQVEITAHRGSSHSAPENTLSAVLQAKEDGADYAEIDVQSTQDGHVVLVHDADLMRIAQDRRRVVDLTLEQLKQVDAGNWFSPEFKGEPIPTLTEAIAAARPDMRLNIELKYNRPDPKLAGRVLDQVRMENFLSECVITSLQFEALREVRAIAPDASTGLIVTAALGDVLRLPVDFLSMDAAKVDDSFVSLAHRWGKSVHVWTVNTRADMLKMILADVDNIITDKPALLAELLQELNELTDAEQIALALRSRLGR
jgi:glycerophosphoryl diester phosphodiesterase